MLILSGGGQRVQGKLWDGTCKPRQEDIYLKLKIHKDEKQINDIIQKIPLDEALPKAMTI